MLIVHADCACSGATTTQGASDADGSDGRPESIFLQLEPVQCTVSDVHPELTVLPRSGLYEPALVLSQEEEEEEEEEEKEEVLGFGLGQRGVLLHAGTNGTRS